MISIKATWVVSVTYDHSNFLFPSDSCFLFQEFLRIPWQSFMNLCHNNILTSYKKKHGGLIETFWEGSSAFLMDFFQHNFTKFSCFFFFQTNIYIFFFQGNMFCRLCLMCVLFWSPNHCKYQLIGYHIFFFTDLYNHQNKSGRTNDQVCSGWKTRSRIIGWQYPCVVIWRTLEILFAQKYLKCQVPLGLVFCYLKLINQPQIVQIRRDIRKLI